MKRMMASSTSQKRFSRVFNHLLYARDACPPWDGAAWRKRRSPAPPKNRNLSKSPVSVASGEGVERIRKVRERKRNDD